jgi:hypothetical protein
LSPDGVVRFRGNPENRLQEIVAAVTAGGSETAVSLPDDDLEAAVASTPNDGVFSTIVELCRAHHASGSLQTTDSVVLSSVGNSREVLSQATLYGSVPGTAEELRGKVLNVLSTLSVSLSDIQ